MNKVVGFIIITLFCSFVLQTDKPVRITWSGVLSDVEFVEKYNKKEQKFFLYPIFGDKVKAMEGREVYIKGYVIPLVLADENILYVLSSNPNSSCFFCGGSGPESIIELELKKGHRVYHTDERLYFKGTLRLNETNVEKLNYILENAEEYPLWEEK